MRTGFRREGFDGDPVRWLARSWERSSTTLWRCASWPSDHAEEAGVQLVAGHQRAPRGGQNLSRRITTSSLTDYLRWLVGPVISTSDSPASRSFSADGSVELRISRTFWFDVLPQVSQRTFGGGPCCWRRWGKSASLVRTMASASRAAWKMGKSLASRKPNSRTARAGRPNVSVIHFAREGES